MQVLAWMWCIMSMYMGSIVVFGVSAIAHVSLLGAVVLTVATFETAKRNPTAFNLNFGYRPVSRTRQYMWILMVKKLHLMTMIQVENTNRIVQGGHWQGVSVSKRLRFLIHQTLCRCSAATV